MVSRDTETPIYCALKSLIKTVKRKASYSGHIDFDHEMETAKTLIKEFGSGQVGAASELGTPIKSCVDKWSEQAGYMAKNLDTARSFVKDDFCSRFPIFETIERRDLKIWVEDQLQ